MPQIFDILFDDLRSNRDKINRVLGAGLLFALIVHFYVLEPYFEYKDRERKMSVILHEQKEYYEAISGRLKSITDLNQKNKQDHEGNPGTN